jgi:hypothetical protein
MRPQELGLTGFFYLGQNGAKRDTSFALGGSAFCWGSPEQESGPAYRRYNSRFLILEVLA